MTTNFVNLTPHTVVLQLADGTNVVFRPSGQLARVATAESPADCGGFPAIRRTMGDVEIPDLAQFVVEPGDGAEPFVPAWLVVSSLVLEAARAQEHPMAGRMCAPDTGPTAIREAGQVKAVVRFVVA